MGVTGLWKLIEPCGKPVPVETLEGKVLAVDVSIWLHQAVKGFQDNKGAALNNAHLLGLFHRLCKLLYFRIKPVFVFDGCIPQLKRDTVTRRQEQRSRLNCETERIQALLLQSLAKEQLVQQALGSNANDLLLTSPLKRLVNSNRTVRSRQDSDDDIFKMPEIQPIIVEKDLASSPIEEFIDSENSFNESYSFVCDQYSSSLTTDEDSSFDEKKARYAYNKNLQAIDVRSKHFRSLPPDVRYEILTDIKETRKQSSWGRLHELPAKSDDFSSFQMRRLLKRHNVQMSLKEAEQEMGGRSLTYAELSNMFTEEGLLNVNDIMDNAAQQICSDEHTRYLLVKDLKKQLSQYTVNADTESQNDNANKNQKKKLEMGEGIGKSFNHIACNGNDEIVDADEEEDIKIAIALSLQDDNEDAVYDEKDFEYNSRENIKLSKSQCLTLKDSAKGPARSYMIEYAGMNNSEVASITNENESHIDDDKNFQTESINRVNSNLKLQEDCKLINNDDSDSSVEWEEVPSVNDNDVDHDTNIISIKINTDEKLSKDDDLFADVFGPKIQNSNNKILQDKLYNKNNIKNTTSADISSMSVPLNNDKIILTNTIFDKELHERKLSILQDIQNELKQITNVTLEDISLKPNVILKTNNDINEDDDKNEDREHGNGIYMSNMEITPNVILKTNNDINEEDDNDDMNEDAKQSNMEIKNKSIIVKHTSELSTPISKQTTFTKSITLNNNPNMENYIRNSSSSKTNKDETAYKCQEIHEDNDEHIIHEVGDILKSQKTFDELNTLRVDLNNMQQDLESERNRQERMGMSITQRMNLDCQHLLRLFGIPYVVAPMEAEAQCAFLDMMQLTQGTITDDSDIWLFGGRTVYKNFFSNNKHVLEFRSESINQHFNCDRNKLIQLACLVGSDYTIGIRGIGAVTALEILAQFSTKQKDKDFNQSTNNDVYNTNLRQSIFLELERFRKWWLSVKNSKIPTGSSTRLALQKKLKNIVLYDNFPNMAVIEAYLMPTIDNNREPFTWGYPDLESIRDFTRQNFGWTIDKTNNILTPIIKKINEKRSQMSIRNYLYKSPSNAGKKNYLQVSKRVQRAIERLGNKNIVSYIDKSETIINSPCHSKKLKRYSKLKKKRQYNDNIYNKNNEAYIKAKCKKDE